MAFQARQRAERGSADYIHAHGGVVLAFSLLRCVILFVHQRMPKSMRGGKIETGQHFEEVVKRFEIPLLQYARRITGDREKARDVVQETFIKFQRNGALDRENKAATWLFTVCPNRALNVCRKERRMMYLHEDTLESQERSPANA